jgi:hypothetical protein
VHLRARAFAKRLLADSNVTSTAPETAAAHAADDLKITRAFALAYARPPASEELDAAKSFLHDQNSIYKERPDATLRVWTDLCQMILASNAFLYVD